MILHFIFQFIMAMLATFAFSMLYNAPKKQYFFCSLCGGFAWGSYLIFTLFFGIDMVIASLLSTFLLTIVSRIFSVINKNPVTVYLVTGIFTLVPGAGIYYTSYYLIMSDVANFQSQAMDTFKIAGAMVIGIVFGFAIPQTLFTLFHSKRKQV